MKRAGYIYRKIYNIDNVKAAIYKASLGKRHKHYVAKILNNINYYAECVSKMLMDKTYIPSEYRTRKIYDGANKKERMIYIPKFYPDQIIHWALILQIENIIMKGMYKYSCGSVPNRGTSYGQKILRKWLDNDYSGTKYCLKMDITKFYPSVDKNILKNMFRIKIKDEDCLWLIDKIIDSSDKGLPIGNYTSQWFSNFFLEGLDHFIKEKLGIKYYLRYVDDLVLLGGNKKKLHFSRKSIEQYLKNINLSVKNNWQVFLIDTRAIDFLGFRFYRQKTILRKRNALRIKRRIKKIARKNNLSYRDACAIVSYWGWIKRSDSYNFYNQYIKPYVNINVAKKRISRYAKNNL